MMRHLILCLLSLGLSAALGAQQGDDITYVCPPCNSQCDELLFSSPGTCEHCGMTLVPQDSVTSTAGDQTTIAFYLQSGVEVLDFAGPLEVLSYAGFKVFTVSKTKAPILSQGVLRVIPDYSIDDAPTADILAFFGGNGFNTSQDSAVIRWVKDQESATLHFSVCTGALILAEAGILNGKTATTFHNAIDYLTDEYPAINVLRNTRFVDNGDVISTAGISAGIDGALHLVAKLKGFNTARATAYNMEYDNWHPGQGLILSPDNPYQNIPTAESLAPYVGNYEHWALPGLEIRYNDRDLGLEAYIREQRFPLYYAGPDRFTDVNGETVVFQRGEDGRITGYKHSSQSGRLFLKTDNEK